MVGVSPLQKAQRAFVTVLLRLAAKYCLQLGVTRDSSAKELTAAFRKVARRTHPDKGGTTADTQALNAAREAWAGWRFCRKAAPHIPLGTSHDSMLWNE